MTEPVSHAAGHGGKASLSLLTKKIGPLPAYAYVLIIVAAAYAYRAYKQHASAANPLPSTATTPLPDAPIGGASSGSVPSDGPNGVVVGQTNGQWALTVSNGMIASGSNPVTVSSGVTKYLAGGVLTAQEAAVITTAVARYGYPPEGVLPIKTVPLPGPVSPGQQPAPSIVHQPPPVKVPVPAPKPAAHTYTVHSGDTLWSIAAHYYGQGGSYEKIASANHITSPYIIHPGQTLTIPA